MARPTTIVRQQHGTVLMICMILLLDLAFLGAIAAAIATDLEAVGRAVEAASIPVVTLGKGSNVLVPDEGFPGLVLRLGRGYRWVARDVDRLAAGAAMPLPALAGVALHHGLSGLEFGIAIPASLGGAVRMNAGAHGREMADVIKTVGVYRLHARSRATLAATDAGFSYRRSALPADAVVVGATLRLAPGDAGAIRATMDEARDWRRRTQPLASRTAGACSRTPPATMPRA